MTSPRRGASLSRVWRLAVLRRTYRAMRVLEKRGLALVPARARLTEIRGIGTIVAAVVMGGGAAWSFRHAGLRQAQRRGCDAGL